MNYRCIYSKHFPLFGNNEKAKITITINTEIQRKKQTIEFAVRISQTNASDLEACDLNLFLVFTIQSDSEQHFMSFRL